MADDSKTEKATPKKRRDERKEGHVFSSKDVIVVVSLLGTFYGLQILFPTIYKTIRENLLYYLNNALSIEELSMAQLSAFGIDAMQVLAICILPLGFISIALAVVATGVQTKFIFTAKSAAFKLSNLSIIKGIKNLFSLRNLIELLKGILEDHILVRRVVSGFGSGYAEYHAHDGYGHSGIFGVYIAACDGYGREDRV